MESEINQIGVQDKEVGVKGEGQVREAVGQAAEDMRQSETARRFAGEGKAFLGEQKKHVAETIHDCSDALRQAAHSLQEKQDPNIASYAEAVAKRLDQTSDYLDSHQFQDIRADLEHFARKQPQIFYGGMFIAGLALARFFKASESGSVPAAGGQ